MLSLGVAFAQQSTPPSSSPSAETTPAPVPQPEPAPPAPSSPASVPETATPQAAQPLSIVFSEQVPVLVNGLKGTESARQVLALGRDRTAQLRALGVTSSLRADIERFAKTLERDPRDARFEFASATGVWRVVQRGGVKVDVEATLANVASALKDPGAAQANVVYTTSFPKRTLSWFASRGLTHFLGEGNTYYVGSSRARVTNIHAGARHFQDRLFEGKTFSFNAFIGEVSAKNGFVPGLVIAGERTATGIGGGICQVSTTAFRSLYAAGLPIRERRNHSYQVHYYDPQGLDATIYQPSQDLKFDNDTGGSLWFQADWDDADARLSIQVFGKPRAELVEILAPRTLKTQPALADRLVVDRTVAPGRRVQVDWAAPGATIEVVRRFTKNGQVVRSDTLRSVYRPWPNIYLVGPSN
ncbi:vancomycin resistance protein YoaR [Deinococcus yavapaiensis KR-236]|uniref:Vancomycin resistance protein YoaR n=2 Tax=Deinococcus TaxID=1298 RepID=A0A318SFL6_9DEIO|nr:vancomycin resistance protein YoaR [Deinococcus yavapaiensis KR-236]